MCQPAHLSLLITSVIHVTYSVSTEDAVVDAGDTAVRKQRRILPFAELIFYRQCSLHLTSFCLEEVISPFEI